jgi:hypothetical protein
MTQATAGRPLQSASFEPVWRAVDAQVVSGRIPGYVAAIRVAGRTELRSGGTLAVGADSAPMSDGTRSPRKPPTRRRSAR